MIDHVAAARAAIETHGLLLLQDPIRPSLATLVAGAVVKGSWWSHPAGKAIFATAESLDEANDLVTAKLVDGKITFVHRRLWPALVAIGRERAKWQLAKLPTPARELLARVDADGTLQTTGGPAKALEQRLLVASAQVHTDSGKHALELSTWDVFATKHDLTPPWPTAIEARALLEATLAKLPGPRNGLPWLGKH
jgi:hypothetical protein